MSGGVWTIERRRQLAQKLGLTVAEVVAIGSAKAESRAAYLDAQLAKAVAVEAAARSASRGVV